MSVSKKVIVAGLCLLFLNIYGPVWASSDGADRARLRSRITVYPAEFSNGSRGLDVRKAEELMGRRMTDREFEVFSDLHERAMLVRERRMNASAPSYFQH
jgi:hypothetical protein